MNHWFRQLTSKHSPHTHNITLTHAVIRSSGNLHDFIGYSMSMTCMFCWHATFDVNQEIPQYFMQGHRIRTSKEAQHSHRNWIFAPTIAKNIKRHGHIFLMTPLLDLLINPEFLKGFPHFLLTEQKLCKLHEQWEAWGWTLTLCSYASGATTKPELRASQVPSFISALTKLGALTRQCTQH